MAINLLIADDSNIIRSAIGRALSKCNINVVATASNGEEAIEAFKRTQPDLVTMDLTMPKMDGIETIRSLRKINTKAHILVVSALADKATAIQALKEGAQGFLYKPFKETELIEAIEEILGGQ